MNAKDYQRFVPLVNNPENAECAQQFVLTFPNGGDILLSCFGLPGEAGEVVDLIKKTVFHNKPLDIDHLKKEIGDVLWYLTLLCNSFGFSLEEVFDTNVQKLTARYPEGFDFNHANNRADGDI